MSDPTTSGATLQSVDGRAIDQIVDLGRKSSLAKIDRLQDFPAQHALVTRPGEAPAFLDLPRPNLALQMHSIESLVAYAAEVVSRQGEGAHPRFLVRQEAIEFVHDLDGYDRAVLYLPPSAELRALNRLSSNGPVEQKDLRYAIRYLLDGAAPEGLERQLEKVGFRSTDGATQESRRGRESLGASITQEVEDEDQMPDTRQRFMIEPTSNLQVRLPRRQIEVRLDPLPAERAWLFFVHEREWARLAADVVADLKVTLLEQISEWTALADVEVLDGSYVTTCSTHVAEGGANRKT